MKKPIIAVMPLYDDEKQSYWMLPGYMKGIEQAGGIPVMLPMTSDREILNILAVQYDGFLFTGGHDVSPQLYKKEKSPVCGEICENRDDMESYLIQEVLRLNKPMLGICRGIQLLNAVLGGTLYQDLPAEYPSVLNHHQLPPYNQPIHKVQIEPTSPLFSLLKKSTLAVNSYHHQAICQLSDRLLPMAYAEDGLIEAVYLPDTYFAWAVQWHPEFSFQTDDDNFAILKEFVSKSATKKKKRFIL